MFKIGDKVKCINPRNTFELNGIYTISKVWNEPSDGAMCKVKENPCLAIYQTRFILYEKSGLAKFIELQGVLSK